MIQCDLLISIYTSFVVFTCKTKPNYLVQHTIWLKAEKSKIKYKNHSNKNKYSHLNTFNFHAPWISCFIQRGLERYRKIKINKNITHKTNITCNQILLQNTPNLYTVYPCYTAPDLSPLTVTVPLVHHQISVTYSKNHLLVVNVHFTPNIYNDFLIVGV